jgi:hypothetical protein
MENDKLDLDPPVQFYTYVEAVFQTQRGRRIDITQDATVTIRGRKTWNGSLSPVQPVDISIQATLALTGRAPIDLHNPDPNGTDKALTGWTNADPSIQNRYFLKTQELLLVEPWTEQDVGSFILTEPFSSLRFDGLQWQY